MMVTEFWTYLPLHSAEFLHNASQFATDSVSPLEKERMFPSMTLLLSMRSKDPLAQANTSNPKPLEGFS